MIAASATISPIAAAVTRSVIAGGDEVAELDYVVNGGFDGPEPWEGGGWVLTGGTAQNDSEGESDQLRQAMRIPLAVGSPFRFSMDVISGTSFAIVIYNPGFQILHNGAVDVGTFQIDFDASDASGSVFVRSNAGPGVEIDNVSIIAA